MDRREQEVERSYTERSQVIEAGKIRAETERQVMRKDRTRRQEKEASDGNECRPSVGSLANRKFSTRFQSGYGLVRPSRRRRMTRANSASCAGSLSAIASTKDEAMASGDRLKTPSMTRRDASATNSCSDNRAS